MSHTSSCVFRMSLFANRRPGVIGLVSVRSPCILVGPACLGQSPSWEILLCGGVSTCFRDISARADSIWSSSLVLQCASATPSKTEGVLGRFHNLWPLLGVVLRAWGLLQTIYLHSRLRANLGSQRCLLSAQVSRNWVIKESNILIKVILGFISSLTFSSSK